MANAAERRPTVVALVVVLSALARPVAAQSASAAEALFEDGRRLMKQGDYPAACAKFQESQRLDPAGGTLMNLAGCHEKAGKTATAWSEFTDARAQAERDKRADRVAEASKRIAELTPLLARVEVKVDAPAPGQRIKLDGTVLGAASWGTPIPIDPGPHQIEADAPDRLSYKSEFTIEAKEKRSLDLPRLVSAPPSIAPRGAPPEVEGREAPRRPVAAFVLGGVGIASVGLGTAFGLVAASKKNDSDPHCTKAGCDQSGLDLLKSANTSAWVSDIAFGAGAASLAVATVLFFTARSERKSVALAPVIAHGRLGLGAAGSF